MGLQCLDTLILRCAVGSGSDLFESNRAQQGNDEVINDDTKPIPPLDIFGDGSADPPTNDKPVIFGGDQGAT